METRLAKIEDQEELREIWRLCFGDEEGFIDLYFKCMDWIKEVAVLLHGGRVVSMLTMIPVDLVGAVGEKQRASMLYAIATHPDFQKRGYADQLIEFSNRYLLSNQVETTLLVPAREELFHFYEKSGYANGFYVREAVLKIDEIAELAEAAPLDCLITQAEPAEYNVIRKRLLEGYPHIDYRDEEIAFQKSLALMFDADLLIMEAGGAEGCAYYERISPEEVLIKELLIRDQAAAAALKRITELVPAEKYIIRTPAYAGTCLDGGIRPFGMIRINESNDKSVYSKPSEDERGPYLGFAYD